MYFLIPYSDTFAVKKISVEFFDENLENKKDYEVET